MKVLYVQDSLGTGGAERSNAELWYFLRKKDVEIKIVVLDRRKEGIEDEILNAGFEVSFLKNGSFYNHTKQIAKVIKEYKPDIVHSVLFRAALRTRFAKLLTNFIHVESLVNTTYSEERLRDGKVNQKALKIYKKLDQYTTKYVDHFHSITRTVKEHYKEALKIPENKFSVIYRGRKPLSLDKMERKSINKNPILINVGRHEFQKGQIYLLKAIKELKELGYAPLLRIFGRNGAVTRELKNYIDQHALFENVELRGYSHKIPEELLDADVFIFPSLYEGLGGALIEAQAAGLPIASNDIPVLREVVVPDVNAKFFDVYNTASVVEAIRFFLDNPEERKKYGKASILNFEKNFMEEKNNAKMLGLYNSLC